MTKANEAILRSYIRSNKHTLWDCYESFSSKKRSAWEYCENLMNKYNGYGLKVISSNGWMFTAGFLFTEDGKDYLMYITKSQDKKILIDEEV